MPAIVYAALISILPIAELRGGIPYGLLETDHHWAVIYLLCVGANLLAFPIVYFFLDLLHPRFMNWAWYSKLFEKIVVRARKKTEKQIGKYGFWGIMVFVMIPLPVTGAYTGTLASWVFNLDRKKSFLAVFCGVVIAGLIVTAVVLTGSEAFQFLTKKV